MEARSVHPPLSVRSRVSKEVSSGFRNANPTSFGLAWEIRGVAESPRRFGRPSLSVRKGTQKIAHRASRPQGNAISLPEREPDGFGAILGDSLGHGESTAIRKTRFQRKEGN